MIVTSFKASLNFSPLKDTYLGKIKFNIIIISAKSENDIEKWPRVKFCSVHTVYNRMG